MPNVIAHELQLPNDAQRAIVTKVAAPKPKPKPKPRPKKRIPRQVPSAP